MKIKNILFNIILAAGILLFGGCNSVLDQAPLDSFINNPVFWSNAGAVESYANSFYEQFAGYGSPGSGVFYFDALNDNQAGSSFTNWYYINVPASSADWSGPWVEIRRSNIMIEGLNTSSLDTATKNHWLGVARLMRAYEYYLLVRRYGNVPWVDKSLNVNDGSILYGPRQDRDSVMDKVLDDLNFAVANVNEPGSKITWSRPMANAMKADICLWEGTYREYRSATDGQKAPDPAGAARFLNACLDACNYVMPKFSLSNDYRSTYNSVDLSGNPEIIFYKAYKQNVLTHSLIDYTCASSEMNGMTKDAFDSYLFTDGKPMAFTALNKDDAGTLNANGNLSITKQLSVRDKRLSQTIDSIVCYAGNTWSRTSDGMQMSSSTGYGVAKFDNLSIPTIYRNQSQSNYTCAPIYWLAVIYLNFAEAKAELGTLTDADLNNSINLLKARAGLPPITTHIGYSDPANIVRVSPLIWEIRRERRCELMFDNQYRYWDLVRWHQLDKLDSQKYPNILLGADIKNDPKAAVSKVGDYIDGSKGKMRIYDSYKYYWFPIPSGQLTLNPRLGQNPGWK